MSRNIPQNKEILAALIRSMRVPNEYIRWRQNTGLFPLTKIFFRVGTKRLNKKISADFNSDPLPVSKKWTRYRPIENLSNYEYQDFISDALGVPDVDEKQISKLFLFHAPILEIDQVDDTDMIGALKFTNGKISVDTNQARIYTYHSFTRFNNRILLQLNYVFWFPERRAEHGLDIYAGKLDGLTWRVTLDPQGRALAYDSIHNCGCYYMIFPTERLRINPEIQDLKMLLIPQFAPTIHANKTRIVIRVSTAKHYLQKVYSSTLEDDGIVYYATDYNRLRSLKNSRVKNSVFNKYGIVPGTNRLEQFLLWPAGIRSPGAMRQRGHQPISFVKIQQFDDADLLDSILVYKP